MRNTKAVRGGGRGIAQYGKFLAVLEENSYRSALLFCNSSVLPLPALFLGSVSQYKNSCTISTYS